MTISKPYTFSPGTKAKASEVNDNFDIVYRQVNNNTNDITTIESNINTIDTNKANKTGSSDTQFNVANPSSGYNAVNKQSMEDAIYPFKKIIYGLTLRRNDNITLGIDSGSCYGTSNGTTYDVPLNLTTSTTLSLSGTDTSERSVYITGNSDGSNIQISFSNLGVDRYRKIGSVWTDSDGNIIKINSYGINATGLDYYRIVEYIYPDYDHTSEQQSVTTSSGYPVESYGWIAQSATNISVNDNTLYDIVAFVKPGDVIKATTSTQKFYFIPCKGV